MTRPAIPRSAWIPLAACLILLAGAVAASQGARPGPDGSVRGPLAQEEAEERLEPDPDRPLVVVGPIVRTHSRAGSTPDDLRTIAFRRPPIARTRLELLPPRRTLERPGARTTVQSAVAPAAAGPLSSFAGLSLSTGGSGWPADPHGDIGPNHYVQAVNTALGIYDRTAGTRLALLSLNSLFASPATGLCATDTQGDPQVLWDPFSRRWIVTAFAYRPGQAPYYLCVAVSKTQNPVTGGWWLYGLLTRDSLWNDYPKVAAWADGIYVTANLISGPPYAYFGAQVLALNRDDLTSGAALRTVEFGLPYAAPDYAISLLAANDEAGVVAPGSPALLYSDASGSLLQWRMTTNWASPGASSLTGPVAVSGVAGYAQPYLQAPQPGVSQRLDLMGDRLMTAAQWTNTSGTPAVWLARTVAVDSGSRAGVFWAEVTAMTASPVIRSQGTYAPADGIHRFMPSLAVDRDGNMAVGYSASSSLDYPSLRYAARFAADPSGTLGVGEGVLVAGSGSQASTTRWGDYFSMSIDPLDRCRFWMTGTYLATTGSDWLTGIASFSIPGCGASTPVAALVPPVSPTASTSLDFTLSFSARVTGLTSSDLSVGGTGASGCAIGEPSGSGNAYAVALTGCGEGTVTVTLAPNSVSDGSGRPGPPASVSATVTVDRSAPVVGAPVPSVTSPERGLGLSTTVAATDGSGVAASEVRVDAGPWRTMRPTGGVWGAAAQSAGGLVSGTVSAVASGSYHTCAVLVGGRVVCWGENGSGQLGYAPTSRSPRTALDPAIRAAILTVGGSDLASPIPGIAAATAVAAGSQHTCALLSGGTVRCWGANASGQLGDGTTAPRVGPVTVSGISTAVEIAAGLLHTCARLADATVRCWGGNVSGGLGDGTFVNRPLPVAVSGLTGATALAAGALHTCAIVGTQARCWGGNDRGQLGDGTLTTRTTPVTVQGVASPVKLGLGIDHSCAIVAAGPARCWGANASGQLGDGTLEDRTTGVVVAGGRPATTIDGGSAGTCAITTSMDTWCWGSNASQELGDPTVSGSTSPIRLPGLPPTVGISSSFRHVCATYFDASVRCWGWNEFGQTADALARRFSVGPTEAAVLPGTIPAGTHALCARATDRAGNQSAGSGPACASVTVVDTSPPGIVFRPVVAATNGDTVRLELVASEPVLTPEATAFSTGGLAGCAVGAVSGGPTTFTVDVVGCTDGTLVASALAGRFRDPSGNAGPAATVAAAPVRIDRTGPSVGLPTLSRTTVVVGEPVLVVAGASDGAGVAALALRVDGGAWIPLEPSGGSWGAVSVQGTGRVNRHVSGLGLGREHSCVIFAGGSIRCWGMGDRGQLGAAATLPSTVTSIGAGALHTCAALVGGQVRCWGDASYAQLGDPAATGGTTPVAVQGIPAAVALAAGAVHTCALLVAGTVACWGYNGSGQTGGASAITATPATVALPGTVRSVAAGWLHSCALLDGGAAHCWGANDVGQGGNAFSGGSTPRAVAGLSDGTALALGRDHSCAIRATGTVVCWGANGKGQLGIPTDTASSAVPVAVAGVSGVVGIAAGDRFTCALLATGRVSCWGSDDDGALGDATAGSRWQPGLVPDLTGATAVASLGGHICAMAGNGSVLCWGLDGDGQASGGAPGTIRDTPTLVSGIAAGLAVGAHQVCIRATDGAGNASAGAACAALTVTGTLGTPFVTAHPATLEAGAGPVSFSAGAWGSPTPTARWQVSANGGSTWVDAAGPSATTGTYSLTASSGDSGKQFRAVFANGLGSATTNPATLIVRPPPSVASFTPSSGGPGTAVTLSGTEYIRASSVTFAGSNGARIAAPLTVASGTTIYTSVPLNAVTGAIQVTAPGGTGTSVSAFTAKTTRTAPTVSGFSPTAAAPGASVTVSGTNLAGVTGATIGGVAVAPSGITVTGPGTIVLVVPGGAVTGTVGVTTAGGTGLSRSSLTVLAASYAVTVTKAGGGSGTVTSSPAGISCGSTCSASFATGALVTLSAASSAGSVLTGWSGGCSGTSVTCLLTVGGAITVTATFKIATAVAYLDPTTATRNTAITLTARLSAGGAALASQSGVTFTVNGKSYAATWNAATSTYTAAAIAPKNAGSYAVTVAYAGTTTYAPASVTVTGALTVL